MGDESERNYWLYVVVGLILLLILCSCCSFFGYYVYSTQFREISEVPVELPPITVAPDDDPDDIGGDLGEDPAARWRLSLDPSSGLSGTNTDINITGAHPNADVLLEYGSMSHTGVTDAQGNWSYRHAFYGDGGDRINLSATVTNDDSTTQDAFFDITGVLEQIFVAIFLEILDPGGHLCCILFSEPLRLHAHAGSLVIEGDDPWVTVTGEIADDGSFTASGTGTVAGFSNIAVTFEGTISMDQIEGAYSMGVNGGLPGGEAITFMLEGKAEGAGESGDAMSKAAAFFEIFNAAQEAGDSAALFGLLHPAVFEIYGSQACMVYLDTTINQPISIEVISATEIGPWEWERDGVTVLVEDAYELVVNVDTGQGTTESESHLAIRPDGSLGWFTDCGEPQ